MSDHAIVVAGLHKRFGDVHAVRGVDLAVEQGTVYGLLGPNGAGKTTIVRVLTTIIEPDGGSAEVLGLDVGQRAQEVRESIGLAGQFAAVDENLTGHENLRLVGNLSHLPRNLVKRRAGELLERFGLADAANRTAKTYSGGMRRRLDLAAALVHRPPVLFLDEPTTGLDPASRKDLWDVIDELVVDGTTVLLTTQYLEEADRLAKRLAVIDRGVVIAEGTPRDLKAKLGATVIDVGFATHAVAIDASIHLRSDVELGMADKDVRVEGAMVELGADEGARTAIKVLRSLDQANFEAVSMAIREPSLDDVFLTLTGHRVEGEGEDEDEVVSAGEGRPRRGAG